MKLEAKIGLFVVMALGALLLLSTQVTSLGKWGNEGYKVQAYVDDASGIEKHSHVLMNGVTVGDVDEITIDGKRVRLSLMIDPAVKSYTADSVLNDVATMTVAFDGSCPDDDCGPPPGSARRRAPRPAALPDKNEVS